MKGAADPRGASNAACWWSSPKQTAGTTLHAPKLPGELFRQAESFFSAVFAKHKAEAVVLLACNPKAKQWPMVVPPQSVQPASVGYDMATLPPLPEGFDYFGGIHSHADMAAFHSGTDDEDEYTFDGFHITVGNFNKPVRTYSVRWVLAGQVYKADLGDAVEMEPPPPCDPAWLEQVRTGDSLRQERTLDPHCGEPAELDPVCLPGFDEFDPHNFEMPDGFDRLDDRDHS